MSTFLCQDGHHLIDTAVSCKGWLQILLISLALFFTSLLAGLVVLSALLYRQSHPDPEDALSETENPLILGMILYRTFVFAMGTFEEKYFGVFIVKYVVMIMMSALFIWQYIKYFPYFDSYMSVLYGYCLFMHAWVIIVSLMTYIVPFSGHLVMFLTGVLPAFLVVFNIRSRLIYELTVTLPDQINSELAAIMQCYSINMLISSKIPPNQEIVLTGMIYFHEKECKDKDCPIHLLNELYDASMGKLASDENTENLRKNQVYLKHYVKLYYTIAVSKFESSPGIRIAYAFFLFYTLRNIHTSLTELAYAKKLNPNITQNFEIYKFE
eukprot:TRINITY_DN9629_c0_g6_i1.p1 TRINITY_DN9629_c0_g6~~TRINITY_DN9629_c0_g6_i1.p1  ORF type:complete len:325 (-),score=54.00 TRINITY_DN9629_c0_g6_i1:505-1479(-)